MLVVPQQPSAILLLSITCLNRWWYLAAETRNECDGRVIASGCRNQGFTKGDSNLRSLIWATLQEGREYETLQSPIPFIIAICHSERYVMGLRLPPLFRSFHLSIVQKLMVPFQVAPANTISVQ